MSGVPALALTDSRIPMSAAVVKRRRRGLMHCVEFMVFLDGDVVVQ
jgi:hypothetical protein